jgi:DNA-binding NarL/FixJ family response regulator
MHVDGAVSVLVVSADPLVRQGLAALLGEAGAVEAVFDPIEAVDSDEVADEASADLVVWDLDGDEPGWDGRDRVLALVGSPDDAGRARAAGATGIVSRSTPTPTLLAAAAAVALGLEVLDPSLNVEPKPRSTGWTVDLSARESEVLELMSEGISNREIAERIGVSPNTAKFHVASVLDKLGAASRTEAVALALRHGVLMI